MRLPYYVVLLVLVFAAGGLTVWLGKDWLNSAVSPSTETGDSALAGASVQERIVALGRLEPKTGIIDVGALAGDRLGELTVNEGDTVTAGKVLGRLASYPLRQQELLQAETQLANATAQLELEKQYGADLLAEAEIAREQAQIPSQEIVAQEAVIRGLTAALKQANSDLTRTQALEPGLVSQQQVEHLQLAVRQAEEELAGAQAVLKRLQDAQVANRRLAEARMATARSTAQRLQGAIQLGALQQMVELARLRLEQSEVKAPTDGQVLTIRTRPGEMVSPMPILQMGDTQHMYAVAEVYETDVRQVKPGQRAAIRTPALDEELAGTVESIGSVVSRNSIVGLDPTAKADSRIVEVRVRLESSPLAARFVNLEVEVQIFTSGNAEEAGNSAAVGNAEAAAPAKPAGQEAAVTQPTP